MNKDELYFKNTFSDKDFKIKKSDITKVLLNGEVKTVMGISFTKKTKTSTYIENLVLTIKTNNDNYTIFPEIFDNDTLKLQIAFYKSYFDNFDVLFDFSGTDTISNIQSMVTAYELEDGIPEKSTDIFDLTLKIITYIIIAIGSKNRIGRSPFFPTLSVSYLKATLPLTSLASSIPVLVPKPSFL